MPSLTNHHSYADFHLSQREWEWLEQIKDALREPSNVQQTFFSSERVLTICIIPSFEFLIVRWNSMAGNSQHQGLKQALVEGIKSLQKWFDHTDGTLSPAYFICLSMFLLHYVMTSH